MLDARVAGCEHSACDPDLFRRRALRERAGDTVMLGLPEFARAAYFAWLLVLSFELSAEQVGTTQVEQTPIDHSTSSVTAAEQAKRWGLTVEDWTRYQHLMQGPRGTWSPNLDPVTSLGVHAESNAERRRSVLACLMLVGCLTAAPIAVAAGQEIPRGCRQVAVEYGLPELTTSSNTFRFDPRASRLGLSKCARRRPGSYSPLSLFSRAKSPTGWFSAESTQ